MVANLFYCTQVINECSEAENWLRERKQQQDALPKHANPVVLVSDLKKKAETLDRFVVRDTSSHINLSSTLYFGIGSETLFYRFCKPTMTKPKPAPKPQTPPPQTPPSQPETQAPEPQTPEQQQGGAGAGGEPTSEGGAQEASGEQMDTDKPDNSAEA